MSSKEVPVAGSSDFIPKAWSLSIALISISVARLSPEPERMNVFVMLLNHTGLNGDDEM